MGTYLNPGNSGFAEVLSEKYVDKTGLIEVINGTIATRRKLTCISRPRRFGKSYSAQIPAFQDEISNKSMKIFGNGMMYKC